MECLVSVNEKNYLPIVETFLIVEILIISAQKEITVEICTLQREREREREKYSQNFVISLLVAMEVPVLVSVSLRLWNLLCSWMYLLLSYSTLPGHHEHVRQLEQWGPLNRSEGLWEIPAKKSSIGG